LNDTFTSTRGCAECRACFFPQHILPLLPLHNAQWWGYESLTAIALVSVVVLGQQLSSQNLHVFRMWAEYGTEIPKDMVAFSDPTPDGKLLASKYMGTANFLVYKYH